MLEPVEDSGGKAIALKNALYVRKFLVNVIE